jgi:hypothetical protein
VQDPVHVRSILLKSDDSIVITHRSRSAADDFWPTLVDGIAIGLSGKGATATTTVTIDVGGAAGES